LSSVGAAWLVVGLAGTDGSAAGGLAVLPIGPVDESQPIAVAHTIAATATAEVDLKRMNNLI
jgi:hypothetical protein